MKHSWQSKLTYALALAFAAIVLNSQFNRAPKFYGRSAKAWVSELGSDEGDKGQAMHALLRLGPEASVPHLISALQSQGTPGYRFLWPWLPQAVQKHLPDPGARLSRTKFHAVVVLKSFGPSASEAIPSLIRLLNDPSTGPSFRCTAIAALSEIGPDDGAAREAFQRSLADPDPLVRNAATNALAKTSPAQPTPKAP